MVSERKMPDTPLSLVARLCSQGNGRWREQLTAGVWVDSNNTRLRLQTTPIVHWRNRRSIGW